MVGQGNWAPRTRHLSGKFASTVYPEGTPAKGASSPTVIARATESFL